MPHYIQTFVEKNRNNSKQISTTPCKIKVREMHWLISYGENNHKLFSPNNINLNKFDEMLITNTLIFN